MNMSHEIMKFAYDDKSCMNAYDEKFICCDYVMYMRSGYFLMPRMPKLVRTNFGEKFRRG